eukprot:GHVU01196693.1.p1 GENE.GHVU01196693.1~~GHVU01196693.1.p1  ORF type:complete len:285 (-),score=42.31 GHVU01196693.1:379-1233(-)
MDWRTHTTQWFLRYLKAQSQASPDRACASCLPCGIGLLCGLVRCCNHCTHAIIMAFSCCVECFERCLEFISSQAYVQTAIKGTNFCRSAIAAAGLIVRSPVKFALSHCLASLVLFAGVLVVCSLVGVGGFFLTEYTYPDISSAVFPTVLYVLVALCVSVAVLNLLSIATDTVLQCYLLADVEGGEESRSCAPEPLQRFMSAPLKGGDRAACCGCCCEDDGGDADDDGEAAAAAAANGGSDGRSQSHRNRGGASLSPRGSALPPSRGRGNGASSPPVYGTQPVYV